MRIEDTDRSRYNENAMEEIFTSLKKLGLLWDEGPEVGGDFGPYQQSERLEIYNSFANELIDKGFAYRCFCSEERLSSLREQQEKSGAGVSGYDKFCRNLDAEESKKRADAGEPFVVRLKIPENRTISFIDRIRGEISFETNTQDDFVLLKTDKFPTYHLANVIDDHKMKITNVLRGDEWITSTPKHLLLYEAFGWDAPEFAHLPIILSEDGSKLSKRKGAASVMDYIDMGILPDALRNFLALLGWNPGDDREVMTIEEIIDAFDLSKVNAKGSIFDTKKLDWMNAEYIKKSTSRELLVPLFDDIMKLTGPESDKVIPIIDILKQRVTRITDFAKNWDYFFNAPTVYDEKTLEKVKKDVNHKDILNEICVRLKNTDECTAESCDKMLQSVVEDFKVGFGKVGLPVRLAITGVGSGASLHDIIPIIGKDACIDRINFFIASVK